MQAGPTADHATAQLVIDSSTDRNNAEGIGHRGSVHLVGDVVALDISSTSPLAVQHGARAHQCDLDTSCFVTRNNAPSVRTQCGHSSSPQMLKGSLFDSHRAKLQTEPTLEQVLSVDSKHSTTTEMQNPLNQEDPLLGMGTASSANFPQW